MPRKLTEKEVINKFIDKHGDRYDYSEVKYKNTRTKVDIVCKEHGIFTQTPKAHLNGSNCTICGLKRELRYTQDEIISNFIDRHGNRYDYSLVKYNGTHIKVDIICKKHGIFQQRPYQHYILGHGCKKCADENSISHNTKDCYIGKPTTLYYIEIKTKDKDTVYKIGLTRSSVPNRFNREKNIDIKILKTWFFKDGEKAYLKEQEILEKYNSSKYYGEKILEYGGNTELFTANILNY